MDLVPCLGRKISFETADPADVRCQSCAANLFVDLVDKLALLEHVYKTGESTCINSNDSVANEMIRDAGQFHDDHTQVLYPFRDLSFNELLHRHVPPDIVDRR